MPISITIQIITFIPDPCSSTAAANSVSSLTLVCRVWGSSGAVVCRPGGLHAQHVCLQTHQHHSRGPGCETRPFRGRGGSGGELRGAWSILRVPTPHLSQWHRLMLPGWTAAKWCLCFQLLGGQKATASFWTFEYYQSFFNVDTVQVWDAEQWMRVICLW